MVAGTSPYAFLHDRRMIPRTMKEQWGVPLSPTQLTQCVRKFGPAIQPFLPTSQGDDVYQEKDTAEDGLEAGGKDVGSAPVQTDFVEAPPSPHSRRQHRRAPEPEQHVTAAKLSAINGRELLLTYSGGPVALYDIFDEPEQEHRQQGLDSSDDRIRKQSRSDSQESDKREGGVGTSERNFPSKMSPRPKSVNSRSKSFRSDFVTENLEEADAIAVKPRDALRRSAEQPEPTYVPVNPILAGLEASSATRVRSQAFDIRLGSNSNFGAIPGNKDASSATSREISEERMSAEGDQAHSSNVFSDDNGQDEQFSEEWEEEEEDDEMDTEDVSSSDSIPTPPLSGSRSSSTIPLVRPRATFSGHRNHETVKDVNFGSHDESLIVSGSDDGNVFIWSKASGDLVGIWKGDESVVNVMQWHPFLPVMAISGIDQSVKILAPTHSENKKFSRMGQREEVMERNKDMRWTNERLAGGMSASALLSFLGETTVAQEGDGDGESGVRRIPLQALLRLVNEGRAQEDGECRIM